MNIRKPSCVGLVSVLAVLGVHCGGAAAEAPAPVAPAQIQVVVMRPPAPPPMVGCSRWEGMISGNDPSAMVRLRLCQSGAHLFGRLQWSSLRSGWNERDIDGSLDPNGGITLRDTAFESSAPARGYRFCLIDRYSLRFANPEQLVGEYDSYACRDHALVSLRRMPGG